MNKDLIVGNKYFGFRLIDKCSCPDYRGDGLLFKHEKTGMEVYLLSTDNSECFFTYTVYTPPEDDTGVFHILEHTVLTGSKKYPVRDPFMALNRNSCNTFLNAMTAPDRTDYPAASPVKKDFDNIFSGIVMRHPQKKIFDIFLRYIKILIVLNHAKILLR